MTQYNPDFTAKVREIKNYCRVHYGDNGISYEDEQEWTRRVNQAHLAAVREEKIKHLVMNISDVSHAAGQIEALTGKKHPYYERRLETLNRQFDELNKEVGL